MNRRMLVIRMLTIIMVGLLTSSCSDDDFIPVLREANYNPIVLAIKYFSSSDEEGSFEKVASSYKSMEKTCIKSFEEVNRDNFNACTAAMEGYIKATNEFGTAGGNVAKLKETNRAYVEMYNAGARIYGYPPLVRKN